MNMTHVTRGLRGDYSPGRGDLTGNRHLHNLDAKDARQDAISNTKNALVAEPLTIVHGRGGQSWAVPTAAYDAILATAEIGARR